MILNVRFENDTLLRVRHDQVDAPSGLAARYSRNRTDPLETAKMDHRLLMMAKRLMMVDPEGRA